MCFCMGVVQGFCTFACILIFVIYTESYFFTKLQEATNANGGKKVKPIALEEELDNTKIKKIRFTLDTNILTFLTGRTLLASFSSYSLAVWRV